MLHPLSTGKISQVQTLSISCLDHHQSFLTALPAAVYNADVCWMASDHKAIYNPLHTATMEVAPYFEQENFHLPTVSVIQSGPL
jgi:hypothetical protein